MATTTAFSGFGFVPSGGADCCTCEEQPCQTHRNCCGTTSPPVWKLDAGSVDLSAPDTDTCADQCCPDLSGNLIWQAISDRVRGKFYEETSPGTFTFIGWRAAGIAVPSEYADEETQISCIWGAVDISNPTSDDPGPEGYFPVKQLLCEQPGAVDPICDPNDSDIRLDLAGDLGYHYAPSWVTFIACRSDGMGGQEARLVSVGQVMTFTFVCLGPFVGYVWVAHARYATAWMSVSALQALIDDAATTPIQLDLVTMTNATYDPGCPSDSADGDGFVTVPSPYGCVFNETSVYLSRSTDSVEQVIAGCVSPCAEQIEDGPYGVLIHSGTIGGVAVRLCLSSEGFNEEFASESWIGTGDFDLSCGSKEIQVRVYCGKLNEEDTEKVWLAEYTNLTDGGSFKTALTITDYDPLASTVSDTLTNFCGSDVVVASIDAAAGPLPNFPCCDLTDAELACLETVPGLSVDETFNISDGDAGNATLTVTGNLPWDEVNGQWGPGDITWSQTGCAFGPIPDTVWEDCTITCDGSGGFTLNVPAPFSLTYNTTGDCGIPISLSFTGVTSVVLCDATTMNVTLDFESV